MRLYLYSEGVMRGKRCVGRNYDAIITNAIIVSLRKETSTKEQHYHVMRKEVCAEMFWVSLGMEYINVKPKRCTSTPARSQFSLSSNSLNTIVSRQVNVKILNVKKKR